MRPIIFDLNLIFFSLRLIQRDSYMLLLQAGLTTEMLSCLVYPRKPLVNCKTYRMLQHGYRPSPDGEHITLVLKSLHWLPVSFRINCKIPLLVLKSIHNCAPQHMSDMLFNYVPSRSLRYSGTGLLTTPKPRTKRHGEAAFSYYDPSLWNSLRLGS